MNPALKRIDLADETAWKGVGEEWMKEMSSFAYVRCVAVKGDIVIVLRIPGEAPIRNSSEIVRNSRCY